MACAPRRAGSDGRPLGGDGTFLEIGAFDGASESTTAFFEQCLGWRGILVEAQPQSFRTLLGNRPFTLNIRVATCPAHGSVRFSGDAKSFSRIGGNGSDGAVGLLRTTDEKSPISVSCGPLGDYLSLLGVTRLDYFSLDVEGSELEVIESLRRAQGLSIGVFQVEVRGDGRRGQVMRALMGRGFSYVGQTRGRPSHANEIIDDVFVNMSHMARFWPQSCAFAPPADGGLARTFVGARETFPPDWRTFEAQLKHMEEKSERCCKKSKVPGGPLGKCHCGGFVPVREDSGSSPGLRRFLQGRTHGRGVSGSG